MTKSETETMACIGLLVCVPVSILLTAFMWGGTGTTLCNWFVVPAFHARPITLPLALGLYLVVSVCRPVPEPAEKTPESKTGPSDALDEIVARTMQVATKCAFALVLGRIYLAFM